MRFKIDWASLKVGSKFTVFALCYFVFEGNFQVQAPRGLIFGGAYTWRDLFSEFYGILKRCSVQVLFKKITVEDKIFQFVTSLLRIRIAEYHQSTTALFEWYICLPAEHFHQPLTTGIFPFIS